MVAAKQKRNCWYRQSRFLALKVGSGKDNLARPVEKTREKVSTFATQSKTIGEIEGARIVVLVYRCTYYFLFGRRQKVRLNAHSLSGRLSRDARKPSMFWSGIGGRVDDNRGVTYGLRKGYGFCASRSYGRSACRRGADVRADRQWCARRFSRFECKSEEKKIRISENILKCSRARALLRAER